MKVTAWEDNEGNLHHTEEAMYWANRKHSLDAFRKQIDAYMDQPGNKLEVDVLTWLEGSQLCDWLDTHHVGAMVIRDYIAALLPSAD